MLEPGFPAGIRLLGDTRGIAAIAALGERLPAVAAFYNKTPEQLRKELRADHSLRVNRNGQLYYACELNCAHGDSPLATEAAESAEGIEPTDAGPFDPSQAFLLHSRPGANRVIYLDFDGHIDNTPGFWKDGAYAPVYNISGDDPAIFSTEERNRIIEIWQRVAEDFSMFDIDVTTEEPGIEALRKTSSSDAQFGMRVVIGGSGSDWFGGNVGGVALSSTFSANQDVPCWVFPVGGTGFGAKNIAEAASHEVGHTLGLAHDGVEGGPGATTGQGNWAPIMGVGYSKPITQWNKGEYANPNNTQDDLAVMLSKGAVYRPDDHGGAVATATKLTADSSSASVSGVIERNTDVDFFRIDAVGSSLVIEMKPTPRGANLRLEVKLYDAGGALLQTATSADVSGVSGGTQPVTLSRTVSAGVYYVSVDGIGNGDPLTTGYTDYASLGQYIGTISGVIPGGFTWTSTTTGTKQWNTPGNWASGIVPNAAGASVRVNNDISGDQTIELATASTLGSLFLGDANSTHAFTFTASGGSMQFNNSGAAASLSKTSGGNDTLAVPVSLVDPLVVNQSASGTLAFSGSISGAGALTKAGAGTVVFSTANNYTGATTLNDGLLRLDNAAGLPGGIDNAVDSGESTLFFKGGVLGLATGDFTRQIGTGAGQLDWDPDTGGAGSGGFAAFGADRQVRLNNGLGTFSWATQILGSGSILILSHPTATHTLNFRNGISFSNQKRTVQVEDGAAAVDAIISGSLIGTALTTAGLNKTGPGVLSLSNANTYPGSTTVADGVLRLQNADALPSGNLELNGGGILGLGVGDFTARTIGTGTDQVQWLGSGGFAAFGANRVVRFSTSSINWNATNFIGTGRVLILSHDSADATLDWQQPISLAANLRIVQVEDGSAAIDAKMSRVIAGGSSGTSNVFTKAGAGTLAFTAQNTYWGDTIVSSGTLMIGDGGAVGGVSQNTPNIIVEPGAILAVNRNNTLTQGTSAFKVAITGDGGFTQAGTGNTVLMLANTYIGPTTLDAGTLTLGAAGVLPDASEVFIGNATLATGSFAETAGRLDITGTATMQLDTGATLAFADSSAVDWTGGTLTLTGSFVSGSSLRFGTSSSGLTSVQLAKISAAGIASFSLNASGYLVAVSLAPPTVTSPTSTSLTATGATIGGNVTADGGTAITERGVVYSVTTANDDPVIGGGGVTKVPAAGTTGLFTVPVTGLSPGAAYSFKAYAINSEGTSYTNVSTFFTQSTNADLSVLSLSSGVLSPAFSSGSTSYTASVASETTSMTLTLTRDEANAIIEVRINGGPFSPVTSGSPSGSLALNVGANPIDVRVTAQAGNTKIYTITVTRDKADQTIIGFTNPGPRVANTTVNLGATGGGSDNPVTFTAEGPAQIDGSNVLSFTGTGSVTVRANQAGNANYYPAAEVAHAFTVTAASATVTLDGLAQTYDGTQKTASPLTNPPGLSLLLVHVPATPVNAGSYGVTATITDPRYVGSATDTLVIAKASQTITFGAIADQTTTATINLSATGGGSGNPVTFSVTGPASLDGNNILTFTGTGEVTVSANQAGDANHEAAPEVAHTFTVSISATVTLSELHQVADGSSRSVIATTTPPDLDVAITYDGNPNAPTLIGSYAVVATITDPLYEGAASGTLVVDDPATMTLINGGQLTAVSALGALDVATYQIARYEVTRGFWNTVRDWAVVNGYDLTAIGDGSANDHPVHSLSWYDAIKWCNARTEWENATFGRSLAPAYRIGTAVFKTGEPDPATVLVDPATSGYRLPTANEWEFAARGGTASTGQTYAGGNAPDPVAWHAGNSAGAALDLSGGRGTWPAGRKTTNELGLYDFSGNVAEWTQEANPANPSTRLLLGGSWNGAASESAIGALNGTAPESRLNIVGLRVARSVASAMAGSLDNGELTWNSGGDQPWFAQTGTSHDTNNGIDAAESGALGQDEESWVETTVTGPGNLSFHWKSASVDGADVLRFSIGASEAASLTGTVDWQEQTVEIPAGDSVLRWRFARTSPANAGASRVWLDEVVYTLATEPVLTTTPATEVTETTATLGGEVTDEGGRSVTARGVVYATTTEPTRDHSVANAASGGTGIFSASGTSLTPGTTYHARAYATNAIGTGYGPEITFTTGVSAIFTNGFANFTRSILPGSRQVFHFTLTDPRIVSLSTLGNGALRAELYDSEGNLLASFDGDTNFDLEELLLAGRYALHVFRQEDGGPAQTFDLTIDASVEAASRPDVAVGASPAALQGLGVYSPTSQTATLISVKANAVTGHASLANRGNLPDVLAARATGGNALFAVSYFDFSGNITAGLLSGTYTTPEMDENSATIVIRATITPNKKKLTKKKKGKKPGILKKTHVLSLRLSSTFDPAISDAASIQVQTK